MIDNGSVEEDILHSFREVSYGIVPDREDRLTGVGEFSALAGFTRSQSELGAAFANLYCVYGKFT